MKNSETYQESLQAFVRYTGTKRYPAEERDYKTKLLETLGGVLTDPALASSGFMSNFRNAVVSCRAEINNLTHYIDRDDFDKYLAGGNADRIRGLLAGLFDERTPLATRIETYKREVDAAYESLVGKGKKMRLGLISCLLAARNPDKYIFYRPSLIENAATRWGLDSPGGEGTGAKYVAYLEFLKPLQEELSRQLGRKADLVDVHSWLWCDYSQANSSDTGWRSKLRDWLKGNPRMMPDELRQLREEFVRRFPKKRLGELTLKQYALGHDDFKDSFCYWLEFKTKKLCTIGGNVSKFWVWWDGDENSWKWIKWLAVDSAEKALAAVVERLETLVRHFEQGEFDKLDSSELPASLCAKPLFLYFPDQFLPVSSEEHLAHFLSVFGVKPKAGLFARNLQLLTLLRSQPDFEGFDTHQMMRFLYDCFRPPASEEVPPANAEAVASLMHLDVKRSPNQCHPISPLSRDRMLG